MCAPFIINCLKNVAIDQWHTVINIMVMVTSWQLTCHFNRVNENSISMVIIQISLATAFQKRKRLTQCQGLPGNLHHFHSDMCFHSYMNSTVVLSWQTCSYDNSDSIAAVFPWQCLYCPLFPWQQFYFMATIGAATSGRSVGQSASPHSGLGLATVWSTLAGVRSTPHTLFLREGWTWDWTP